MGSATIASNDLQNKYKGFDKIPAKASLKPQPFEAHVSEQAILEFKQLLQLSRLGPVTYENTVGEDFGITRKWLGETKQYWSTKYNWRKAEEKLNSFPNFKVPVESNGHTFNVHFVALFSRKAGAVPITLLHGWPGSIFEFLSTLALLQKKYSATDLPYHIVVPSLPGYGYSSGIPTNKDFNIQDLSAVIDKLMIGLGFGDGYIAQGGDVGSFVARILGVSSKSCKAVHLNLTVNGSPDDVPLEALSDAEKAGLARGAKFSAIGGSYARQHGNKPATIGHVLSSSPLALLSWIGEKYLTWVDQPLSLDDILDSVSLYWFTECFPTSIFGYREFFGAGEPHYYHPEPQWHLTVPTGYSWFPKELNPIPKSWMERSCNLVWYKAHNEGGHFAALERPQTFLEDVEDFVIQVWKV